MQLFEKFILPLQRKNYKRNYFGAVFVAYFIDGNTKKWIGHIR